MLTLERAKELLNTTTTEEHLFLHAKNVSVAMGGLAKYFGEDEALFTIQFKVDLETESNSYILHYYV